MLVCMYITCSLVQIFPPRRGRYRARSSLSSAPTKHFITPIPYLIRIEALRSNCQQQLLDIRVFYCSLYVETHTWFINVHCIRLVETLAFKGLFVNALDMRKCVWEQL